MKAQDLEPGMLLNGVGLFMEINNAELNTAGYCYFDLWYIDIHDPYYGKVCESIYDGEERQFQELYPRGSEDYVRVVRKMIESREEAKHHAEQDITWMETLLA